MVNGERRPGIALRAGAVDERLTVPLRAPVFVRAEVWDSARTAAGPPVEHGSTIESGTTEGGTMEVGTGAGAADHGTAGPAAVAGTADEGAAGAGAAGRGRCIALTNPIWYVPQPGLAAVPVERRA